MFWIASRRASRVGTAAHPASSSAKRQELGRIMALAVVTELSHYQNILRGEPAMTEHISKQYDQDLEAIRTRMMQMGGLVESQIRAAVDGFMQGDIARIEQVIAADAK